MSRKRNFLTIILLMLTLTLVLGVAACTPSHEHSFATAWSNDVNYHWHVANCEHEAEIADKAEHTIDGGICTVCNYNEWENAVANLNVGFFDENLNWSFELYNREEKEIEVKSNKNLVYIYDYGIEGYIEKFDGYYDGYYNEYAKDDNDEWNSLLNITEETEEYVELILLEESISLKKLYDQINGLEAVYDAETKIYEVNTEYEFMLCTVENGKIVKIEAGEDSAVYGVIYLKYDGDVIIELPEELGNLA